MSPEILSLVESILFIGLFLIVFLVLVPRAIKKFRSWKISNKDSDLTLSIGFVVMSLFLLSGDFVIFIRAFIR